MGWKIEVLLAGLICMCLLFNNAYGAENNSNEDDFTSEDLEISNSKNNEKSVKKENDFEDYYEDLEYYDEYENDKDKDYDSGHPNPLAELLPLVKFDCSKVKDGYYADTDFDCKIFHYCQNSKRHTFMCPPKSWFNQGNMICDYDELASDDCESSMKRFLLLEEKKLEKSENFKHHTNKPTKRRHQIPAPVPTRKRGPTPPTVYEISKKPEYVEPKRKQTRYSSSKIIPERKPTRRYETNKNTNREEYPTNKPTTTTTTRSPDEIESLNYDYEEDYGDYPDYGVGIEVKQFEKFEPKESNNQEPNSPYENNNSLRYHKDSSTVGNRNTKRPLRQEVPQNNGRRPAQNDVGYRKPNPFFEFSPNQKLVRDDRNRNTDGKQRNEENYQDFVRKPSQSNSFKDFPHLEPLNFPSFEQFEGFQRPPRHRRSKREVNDTFGDAHNGGERINHFNPRLPNTEFKPNYQFNFRPITANQHRTRPSHNFIKKEDNFGFPEFKRRAPIFFYDGKDGYLSGSDKDNVQVPRPTKETSNNFFGGLDDSFSSQRIPQQRESSHPQNHQIRENNFRHSNRDTSRTSNPFSGSGFGNAPPRRRRPESFRTQSPRFSTGENSESRNPFDLQSNRQQNRFQRPRIPTVFEPFNGPERPSQTSRRRHPARVEPNRGRPTVFDGKQNFRFGSKFVDDPSFFNSRPNTQFTGGVQYANVNNEGQSPFGPTFGRPFVSINNPSGRPPLDVIVERPNSEDHESNEKPEIRDPQRFRPQISEDNEVNNRPLRESFRPTVDDSSNSNRRPVNRPPYSVNRKPEDLFDRLNQSPPRNKHPRTHNRPKDEIEETTNQDSVIPTERFQGSFGAKRIRPKENHQAKRNRRPGANRRRRPQISENNHPQQDDANQKRITHSRGRPVIEPAEEPPRRPYTPTEYARPNRPNFDRPNIPLEQFSDELSNVNRPGNVEIPLDNDFLNDFDTFFERPSVYRRRPVEKISITPPPIVRKNHPVDFRPDISTGSEDIESYEKIQNNKVNHVIISVTEPILVNSAYLTTNRPRTTPNYRSKTTTYRPRTTATYRPRTTPAYRQRTTTTYRPRTTSTYKPRTTTTYRPQTKATYRPKTTTTYRPRTTIYKPITSYIPKIVTTYKPTTTTTTLKESFGVKKKGNKRIRSTLRPRYRYLKRRRNRSRRKKPTTTTTKEPDIEVTTRETTKRRRTRTRYRKNRSRLRNPTTKTTKTTKITTTTATKKPAENQKVSSPTKRLYNNNFDNLKSSTVIPTKPTESTTTEKESDRRVKNVENGGRLFNNQRVLKSNYRDRLRQLARLRLKSRRNKRLSSTTQAPTTVAFVSQAVKTESVGTTIQPKATTIQTSILTSNIPKPIDSFETENVAEKRRKLRARRLRGRRLKFRSTSTTTEAS